MKNSNTPKVGTPEWYEMMSSDFNYNYKDKVPYYSFIPYIADKAVTLTNAGRATGAHLSTNLLDSIALKARNAGLPITQALGLVGKESTFGNPTDNQWTYKHNRALRRLYPNGYKTAQNINEGLATSEQDLVNYFSGFNNPFNSELEAVDRKYGKEDTNVEAKLKQLQADVKPTLEKANNMPDVGNKSVLQSAFEMFRDNPNSYNPNQKGYADLINTIGNEVIQSPEIQRWWGDTGRNIYYTGNPNVQPYVDNGWDSIDYVDRVRVNPKTGEVQTPTTNHGAVILNEVKVKASPQDNEYAEGGELKYKPWSELSLAEKSDMIGVGVKHGLSTLHEIRDAYEDMMNPEHKYLNGGYKPSQHIKNYIALKEGSSMQTNRSFEAEARDFWNAIPSDVKKGLTQQQADALYSYSYNVGAGNFKKRVVPSLERYFNGNGSVEDVQRHMYATGDKDYRGLAKRRTEERAMFAGKNIANAVPVSYNNAGNIISTSYSPLNFDVNNNFQTTGYLGPVVNESTPNRTKMLMDALEDEPKQQTIVDDTPEPQYNSLERLQNMYRMFGLDDYANEIGKYNPFASLTFSKGGRMHRYDGNSEDSQQMHINQMPKNPTIYRTAEGGFTTASGHPVEELGWNEDGYMRYRDTVTGDLGTAFEPSEAYTKYLIPQELTAKIQNSGEKPLEAVYPEFDVITAGGIVKDAAKLATEKAIEKLAQNKTVRNSITSLMMDTQSRMPFGSTYNEGRTLLNPYFEDYLESNIMRSNGYSNPLINLNPDGSWNMQKITDDIQTGSRDAIDFLGSTIKEQADKHNMELAKRLGYKFFDPYKEGAKRASVSIKPDVVTLTSSGDPVLGSIYTDSSDPKLDQMGLNLFDLYG